MRWPNPFFVLLVFTCSDIDLDAELGEHASHISELTVAVGLHLVWISFCHFDHCLFALTLHGHSDFPVDRWGHSVVSHALIIVVAIARNILNDDHLANHVQTNGCGKEQYDVVIWNLKHVKLL